MLCIKRFWNKLFYTVFLGAVGGVAKKTTARIYKTVAKCLNGN